MTASPGCGSSPLARDLGVNSNIVTDRLGDANESVTQQIYTHKSTGQDRAAAEVIAGLIAEALRADGANLCVCWSLDFRGYAARPCQASLTAWISAGVGSAG